MAHGVLLRRTFWVGSQKKGMGEMTDKSVTQPRAVFSRAVGAVVAALLLATAAIGAHGRHVAPFVAVDLGSLGGNFSEASAVSPKGLVVGRSSVDGDASVFHAFVWSRDAGMTDLGTLGGGSQSWATAISDNGVIAGFGFLPGGTVFHAFVRTPANGVVDLSTLVVLVRDRGQLEARRGFSTFERRRFPRVSLDAARRHDRSGNAWRQTSTNQRDQ
jgi:probable HAF family extracellular repeat protein